MLPDIHARGATVVTLSPQLHDFASAWAREDGIGFDVLTDLGNGVARSYGLTFRMPGELRAVYRDHFRIDLGRFNGDTTWELAIPATYVIGQDGIVAYAAADADYTRRPEPSELLPVLEALG